MRENSSLVQKNLYSTQIGTVNVDFPKCNQCNQLHKVRERDEVLTLQALYDYCSINPSNGRAIYIHNEGYASHSQDSERLRRILTRGVLRKQNSVQKCPNIKRVRKGCAMCVLLAFNHYPLLRFLEICLLLSSGDDYEYSP